MAINQIKYDIKYEGLMDSLVTDKVSERRFEYVRGAANEFRLELSETEFTAFFELWKYEKDIKWMMHKMSTYNISFTDALITFITC